MVWPGSLIFHAISFQGFGSCRITQPELLASQVLRGRLLGIPDAKA